MNTVHSTSAGEIDWMAIAIAIFRQWDLAKLMVIESAVGLSEHDEHRLASRIEEEAFQLLRRPLMLAEYARLTEAFGVLVEKGLPQ